jgi:hypothetical protein
MERKAAMAMQAMRNGVMNMDGGEEVYTYL